MALTIDRTNVSKKETPKIVRYGVSDKLDFNPQIENLNKQKNKLVGDLKRLCCKIDKQVLDKIANATILAKISYALIVIANPQL